MKISAAKAKRLDKAPPKKAVVKQVKSEPRSQGKTDNTAALLMQNVVTTNAQTQKELIEHQNQLLQDILQAVKEQRPVRLKVHRDKNKLIEYMDLIPLKVVEQ